jgi:hypothetical protein
MVETHMYIVHIQTCHQQTHRRQHPSKINKERERVRGGTETLFFVVVFSLDLPTSPFHHHHHHPSDIKDIIGSLPLLVNFTFWVRPCRLSPIKERRKSNVETNKNRRRGDGGSDTITTACAN